MLVLVNGVFKHDEGERARRHLRQGPEREGLATKLKLEAPSMVQKHLYGQAASDILDMGNFTEVPTSLVLKKISCGNVSGGDFDKNRWLDLSITKEVCDNVYGPPVHVLSQHPFKVVWHKPAEISNFVSKPSPYIVHIDATGSVVKNLPWTDKKILYYAAVTEGPHAETPITVSHFLSDDHRVKSI